jgi:hypothetical protein
MSTTDQLTDEERAIAAFLEVYFEKHSMPFALAMLRNERTTPDDLIALIDIFRDLC